VVLHKLYADRPEDVADVVVVLTHAQPDLDLIRDWSERLRVTHLLDRCLEAAGEIG